MKHLVHLLVSALLAVVASGSFACSCFGPKTFCGTLDPPFPQPEWWIPDAVILAVKLSDESYGADMKVVRSFSGSLEVDEVIRVWGDCGLLCRYYIDGPAIGDTVLWAIQETDLSGNWGCGTELEQPQDFQLSVCGVYWLGYADGVVSGPITTEGASEEMGLDEFEQLVNGCLSTGIQEEKRLDPITVRQGIQGTWVSMDVIGPKWITLLDAGGRTVFSKIWDGSPLGLNWLHSGVYLVTVRTREQRWQRKIAIP